MEKLLIKNSRIVLENEIIVGNILIDEGIIKEISSKNIKVNSEEVEVLNAKGNYIIPGFIDVHIHGSNGSDVMDGTKEALINISKFIVKKGVTNFLATTLTSPKEELINVLKILGDIQNLDVGGANIFGVHMEGPYFDVEYKGAQDENFIKDASIKSLRDFLTIKNDLVKLMSISPHTKGAYKGIEFLKRNGVVVSVGHSGATYDEVMKGIDCGISHSTHTYNGMKGLNHREPGVVGAIMSSDKVNAEIIFDEIHVHRAAVDILIRAKGVNKVLCITDAISATGLPDGDYKLGKLDVYVKNSQARLKMNDALAGSVLTMDRAFRNILSLGYTIYDAIKMTSTNAANEFNLNSGEIKIGKQGDLVILDDDYNPKATIVNGKIKFNDIN
ncbi:N-acetylglucosamine-6-phosphate deacetylase [Fusobacterium sp. MFO224]|uniref:N-acetylglucosamine-6-phosphate deacetylase n=1 Tax=Fusobacterium sp. MFO224 TaxID=3378070 RepID=UPI003854ABC8